MNAEDFELLALANTDLIIHEEGCQCRHCKPTKEELDRAIRTLAYLRVLPTGQHLQQENDDG